MYGLKALQKTADLSYTNEIPTSVYNPSGMYGLKAMGKFVPDYPSSAPPPGPPPPPDLPPPLRPGEEDGQARPPQDG